MRLAVAVKKLFNAGFEHGDTETVLRQFFDIRVFDAYLPTYVPRFSMAGPFAWLDKAEARQMLVATLQTYLAKLSSNGNSELFQRVQEMATQLDALHSEQIDERHLNSKSWEPEERDVSDLQ
jgi:hypothetical protein